MKETNCPSVEPQSSTFPPFPFSLCPLSSYHIPLPSYSYKSTGTLARMSQAQEQFPKHQPALTEKLAAVRDVLHKSISPIPPHPEPSPSATAQEAEPTTLLQDVKKLGFEDVDTLVDFLGSAVRGQIDDNDMLLERLIELFSKLPPGTVKGKKLEYGLINQLWNGVEHPPMTTLAEEHKYRAADGSNNNIHSPKMGAAGTAYARSAPPIAYQNPNQPEPSLVFDMLFARGDDFKPHPNKISSVLFYLATIITHDIFQTDGLSGVNKTSSYLDLAPLYGRNQEEQDAVRTKLDGRLKPDSFSSKRVLGFPPGVGVMLIMFNRFHNYIVTQLASINENNRFDRPTGPVPDPSDDAPEVPEKPESDVDQDSAEYKAYLTKKAASDSWNAWAKYDNDLFQTARLITCGLYVSIVLRDYVRTILNMNRTASSWALDPRTNEGKSILRGETPEGTGNQVSVEFNLIYRWHCTISPKDDKWTQEMFAKELKHPSDPDKKVEDFTLKEFGHAIRDWEQRIDEDPVKRGFADLKRGKDGSFREEDLAKIFKESVEDVAGSYGANRIPEIMKPIELLGIMNARKWNVSSLNEFREFFGLTRHPTFEDINPDPEVVKKLRYLYGTPDQVELYPGLVAEKAKPPMAPGSGLCGNFTMTRAILSDAVALVRGDRFYTIDYTPKNLTNWGFNQASYDHNVDQSHVLYKLVYRAFPNSFKQNSIYAHFPMTVPSENKKILESIDRAYLYSWDEPKTKTSTIPVFSHKAVSEILYNQTDFKVTWGEAIRHLVAQPGKEYGKNFCLAGDGKANMLNRTQIRKALISGPWEQEVWRWYTHMTPKLLEQNSFPIRKGVNEVDIVRDVINLTNTRFNAALFCLPIKNEDSPWGVYTDQELYMVVATLFQSVFLDADVANSFKLRTIARELGQGLGKLMTVVVQAVAKAGFITDIVAKIREGEASLPTFGNHLIERLIADGKDIDEVIWGTIMPVVTANVTNQSQVMALCIDYYLGEGKQYLGELYDLAHQNTAEADEKLMKYMLEGCRLRGTVAVYREAATNQVITDYAPCLLDPNDPSSRTPVVNDDIEGTKYEVKIPKGQRVLCNLMTAGRDPTIFEAPGEVRLDRPLESYVHFGLGPHWCAGKEISRVAQTSLFKQIVGLKNLRRAEGGRGKLKNMPAGVWNGQVGLPVGGARNGAAGKRSEPWLGLRAFMTADQSSFWPVPTTMKVEWDA
ncbi:linoleate diol synthase [Colletotrichum higginsianum IMI 349063]|uniref:linoleate 8R-lipoxygenase n=1 Tax=Colletotrichum higginsianum (strain IMI 349063) TaxID=759273 RepID=A0A1B7YH68_COLHI|nr:linoleate diol synthase [Colletotrichum higginsianum IMI 349063]OBR11300.1 linoleate diol synthase [Colletotrichum higginsianum IMI 349063]